ncbi:hypothetical protein ACFV0C_14030 [Streptomyces sp. NPDC059568]|uniref:hypothetical protein n=1 Tax=Streptomyces sp. NPDC059568 TaxID=3346868 RepID=UPI003679439A
MTTTENCNGTVAEVIGSVRQPRPVLGAKVFLGSDATQQGEFALHIANHLVRDLPMAPPATWEAAQDLIARLFGEDTNQLAARLVTRSAGFADGLRTLGVNEFARPTAVGQGLSSGSLGASHATGAGFAVHDYHNNRDVADLVNVNRALWGFHWGGVVAMDGTDYLTLENYARNAENAGGNGEGLFCFQVYGAAAPDTWHRQWTRPPPRGKGFANALSVAQRRRQPPRRAAGLHRRHHHLAGPARRRRPATGEVTAAGPGRALPATGRCWGLWAAGGRMTGCYGCGWTVRVVFIRRAA